MLAVLLAIAAVGPVKPVHSPAPVHYRIDAKSRQDVDLSAFGQPSQTSELTAKIFLGLTMMDTTGGKLAHIVIDSISFDATGSMQAVYTAALADSAKGTFIHAYVVDGKVKDNAKLQVENGATQLARQTLSLLFAGTRAGAKTGDSWTDTTNGGNKSAASTQTTTVVTGWKVTNAEGGLLTVEGTGAGKSTIESPQQNATGTSTSKTTVTSPSGGPSRSAALTSQQVLQVTVPGAPEPIPVTATSSLTLTILN